MDRKKHIFKLAQGEYIAPEKIENIYIRSEAVVQAFVHGDSLQVRRGVTLWEWNILLGYSKYPALNGGFLFTFLVRYS